MQIEELENKIINADCMDILKQLPDKSIDLILTYPPYKQEFHGRGMSKDRPKYLQISKYGSSVNKDYKIRTNLIDVPTRFGNSTVAQYVYEGAIK